MIKLVKKGNFIRGYNSWVECWVYFIFVNISKNEILFLLIFFVIGDLGKDMLLNSVCFVVD